MTAAPTPPKSGRNHRGRQGPPPIAGPGATWHRPFLDAVRAEMEPVIPAMAELAALAVAAGRTDGEIDEIIRQALDTLSTSLAAAFRQHVIDVIVADLSSKCAAEVRSIRARLTPSGRA